MEWAGERSEAVPRNIFELGLKTFIGETSFVLAYADWLAGVGDDDNARALFERAIAAAPPDQAPERQRPLWERYIQARACVLSLPPLPTTYSSLAPCAVSCGVNKPASFRFCMEFSATRAGSAASRRFVLGLMCTVSWQSSSCGCTTRTCRLLSVQPGRALAPTCMALHARAAGAPAGAGREGGSFGGARGRGAGAPGAAGPDQARAAQVQVHTTVACTCHNGLLPFQSVLQRDVMSCDVLCILPDALCCSEQTTGL